MPTLAARQTLWPVLLILAALTGCSSEPGGAGPLSAAPNNPSAMDVMIVNADVRTMDSAHPRAQALGIRGELIGFVGSAQEATAFIGPDTTRIDAHGATVLPGFHDAHVHPVWSGVQELQCALQSAGSLQETLTQIRACAQRQAGQAWVVGGGWDLSLFADGNAPKGLLDEIEAERPIYLAGADGHSAWVNSLALQMAGIDAATSDPPLGVIERAGPDGEPGGTLRESAMDLVSSLLPPVSDQMQIEAAHVGLRIMNKYGVTSFIDAMVGPSELAAYRALDSTQRLTARVQASLVFLSEIGGDPDSFEQTFAHRDEYTSPRFKADSIKIFVDGVLEGETAALLQPYAGEPPHSGTLSASRPQLIEAAKRFDALGIQVHMHAIGDRAVRAALDAVQAAREANGGRGPMHHIAHLQLIHPDDLARFGALRVAANFQALWANPDEYITDINLPAVGAERVQRMYPIASGQRAGAMIGGGSDWNVSSPDPLQAMEVAITRRDPTGVRPGVLNAGEALTLDEVLAAYTINVARLMGHDDSTGSLSVGKQADVVVLDAAIHALAPEQLSEVKVVRTMLAGQSIYQAE